jgi:hypothetical protein
MPNSGHAVVGKRIRVLFAVALFLGCASCGGFESIPPADLRAGDLVGHQVRVTTTDGRTLVFRVVDVTDSALVGEFERARFEDVALVERREYQPMGTVAALLGGAALLLGLLYSGAG